jgi:hypothetical protein
MGKDEEHCRLPERVGLLSRFFAEHNRRFVNVPALGNPFGRPAFEKRLQPVDDALVGEREGLSILPSICIWVPPRRILAALEKKSMRPLYSTTAWLPSG